MSISINRRDLILGIAILVIGLVIILMIRCARRTYCNPCFDRGTFESAFDSCGTFIFREPPTITDGRFVNGVGVRLDFELGDCEPPPCQDDSVGFIQIVRTVSCETGKFSYPSLQKRDRATSEGWYIDRPDGFRSPYYGRKDNDDDGFKDIVKLGRGVQKATMTDQPYRPQTRRFRGIVWEAVTVSVWIARPNVETVNCNSSAYRALLSQYYWSWTVADDGTVKEVQRRLAPSSLKSQVTAALGNWNSESSQWDTFKFPH